MTAGESDLYVYALAEAGLPETLRIGRHSLHTISVGSVDVIVERGRDRVPPTIEALQDQHDLVSKLAERAPAVLPARFGSVLPESALRALIREQRQAIAESIAQVRGRRQMTIRVFGAADLPAVSEEPPLTGTEFLNRRRAQAHYVPPELAAIRTAVGGLASAERIDVGQAGLRLTVFHLVASDMIDSYRKKASALQSVVAPNRVSVSGPWPAFAFTPELF
jgi:hypothetical protein